MAWFGGASWLAGSTLIAVGGVFAMMACSISRADGGANKPGDKAGAKSSGAGRVEPPKGAELATFAGGCFWCMEPPFEQLDGVYSVISGYTGGSEVAPAYEDVASGRTGHREAIQIAFDPKRVPYSRLLEVFWQQIDPTDDGGQFADRGKQYQTAIYYHSPEQQTLAQAFKRRLQASGRFKKPLVTPVLAAQPFYPAETYHQDFYKKDPKRYKSYRRGSGREGYLQQVWGPEALRERLNPMQYNVTQEDGTEPPFRNAYWDNKEPGIYVDVVSGEPLFSSTHKYKSGSGWPSFTQPIEPANIVERRDTKLAQPRTEVRSRRADSHLGHVFDDGPAPTGQRYCINSASLRFVPVSQLEAQGYGAYRKLFE